MHPRRILLWGVTDAEVTEGRDLDMYEPTPIAPFATRYRWTAARLGHRFGVVVEAARA